MKKLIPLIAILLLVGCASTRIPMLENQNRELKNTISNERYKYSELQDEMVKTIDDLDMAWLEKEVAVLASGVSLVSAAISSLRPVYFDFDESELDCKARESLLYNAGVLSDWSGRWDTVIIGGHTCDCGSEEYNLALSERRANACLRFFSVYGLDMGRIRAVSYGETFPRTNQHELNRCVILKVNR